MTQENHVLARRDPPVSLMMQPEPGSNGSPDTRPKEESLIELLYRVHRALRGRYALVIFLGLLGAAAGGVAGWRFAPFRYRSEALVRIAYELPQVFQETDQNKPMIMFDTFLQSQKLLITSRRVVDLAIQEPAWKATGRGASPEVVMDFADNLEAAVTAKTEYIRIAYNDYDPAVAAAGVNAVVAVYSRIYDGQEGRVGKQVLTAAEERRKALTAEIESIDRQMETAATEFGSTNADPLYEAAAQRVAKLQVALTDVQMALARVAPEEAGTPAATLISPNDVLVAQIAARDDTMRKYCEQVSMLEGLVEMLKLRYGEGHRLLQHTRAQLDLARRAVAQYAQNARLVQQVVPPRPDAPRSKDVLLAEKEEVTRLLNKAREEMVGIGQKQRTLLALRDLRENTREELVRVARRIETLQAEGALGGRLSVISSGEVPLAPARNLRLPVAAAGAMVGGVMPGALLLLWGLYKGRYRFSDDTQAGLDREIPLLGILPMLQDSRGEQDTIAAQCIHQIRLLLEAAKGAQPSRALLVTSATAGEGKTSVTLSLGLSFAAAGVRTLVIDFDLVSRRLSRNLCGADQPGLPEALRAGHLNGYTQELSGVSILAAGSAGSLDPSTVSTASVHRLLAAARKEYDLILIDSGPILGSIEAAVAAREVDGAVVTISRGQEQSLVSRSLAQLKLLGTHVDGVIFNRAEPRDFFRSIYVYPQRTDVARKQIGLASSATTPAPACPFGPLVRAVLASVPARS